VKALSAVRRIDARIVITGALIAAICAVFWLDSRYPSLQGKAGADPREALATPLGFEKHFPEPARDETLKHIVWTAAEWAITNKQGMTFGLLLAAGLLTLVPLLPTPRGGKFAGSVQGAMVGAPLGVCVNCAAPIGQAMLKGGSRVEVALAVMFSSPSFNVIVLGMLISLFPWHLVLLKLVTSAIMVLLVVPYLARLAERPGWRRPPQILRPVLPGLGAFQRLEAAFGKAEAELLSPQQERPKGLLHALAWVVLRYPRNLWTVVRLALPLMALAGILGAVLTEILPWEGVIRAARIEGVIENAVVLVVVAAFGTLLPVPIAFDIVICSVLWSAGVPVHVVASLLVTLGIYSVYPWSLLGTTLSWRLAGAAGAAAFALGMAAGSVAGILERWHDIDLARDAAAVVDEIPAPDTGSPVLPVGRTADELRSGVQHLPANRRLASESGLELRGVAFERSSAATPKLSFARLDGALVGFERLPMVRPYLMMQPGTMDVNSLAAGDVNDDNWPDIAVASHFGVFLYVNVGGHFALQQIDFPAMRKWMISVVALVDLDGDGASDLFFCAWMHGCHVLFNRKGEYSQAAHTELPRLAETAIHAAAFADVNRDGLLDVVTGASTFSMWNFYPAPAVNHLWLNRGEGRFDRTALPGAEGETLALLFTDLNSDGWQDLIVGNDFDEPDRIYLNENGQLRPVTAAESPVPYSTATSMSLDTGDLNNDGKPELYIGQIAMGTPGGDLARRLAPPIAGCNLYAEDADRSRCDALARFQTAVTRARDRSSIGPCQDLTDPLEQRDCVVTGYYWNQVLVRLPALGADQATILAECGRIPKDYEAMHDVCATIADSPMDRGQTDRTLPEELPSLPRNNLLFTPGESGYEDVTSAWHVGFGGWTWNAKFVDLDNDSWQDLFIVQGTRLRHNNVSAVFYRNQAGTTFKDETRAFGLTDHNPTGSSVFVDYDVDGDLDVFTYPSGLSPVVWRNDAPAGGGLEVKLVDRHSRNRAAIGARVEIQAGNQLQIRDIKAGGGYKSYDPPLARFGLGKETAVSSIRIIWPDGEDEEIAGLSLSSGRYTIVRRVR
jgi:uncharacterized membrane protein YraQ (UPF0718 family)